MTSRSVQPFPDIRDPRPGTLYRRIRDELRADIVAGHYAPHARLPSESALIQRYGVSRITVRQALGELEKEGVLFRVAGKGMFVSKPKPAQSLARLQGFAEAMTQQGHEIYNRLLELVFPGADSAVAQRLAIVPGTRVAQLRRVRYLNREPVSVDISYLSEELGLRLARADLATRDIFLILENDCGIALGFADIAIAAHTADAELAALLQVAVGAPLLRIERLTHTAAGAPLDFEYLYCRTDNFQFRLRITR